MIEKLIDFALHNRLPVVVMVLLVMGAGYRSYDQLPVDAFPDVSPNLVQVFTITEGLAPEEIERYVTYPVEVSMTGLPGIRQIRSISNFGLSVVSIYFEDDMDIYFTRRLVSERLQEAREEIPEGFGEPEMGPIATGMGLILYYYLEDTSDRYSLAELRTMQDWIVKYQLQTVPGVTEVLGIGGHEKQFQVNIDPQALLRYNLSLHDIILRIQENNVNVGAQFLSINAEEFVVRSEGLAHGVDDLANIVVKTDDGRPVYLRDVADIMVGGAIRRGLQTLNGEKDVVAGMVVQLYGTNASTVIERVEAKVEQIQKALPQGVRIVPYYEQSELVRASVSTVQNALLQGIALVAIVLLVFMGGLRPSLVVALSIPFSVLFATLAMGQFGISANLMSLGGLAIAIGMMVDGAIVMVENVDRLLHKTDPNESRHQTVARACREVARPILFAITIVVIVFLPLFTLQGVEGKTFRPLAYTVALAMLGSLIFALIAAPVFSELLMRRRKSWQQQHTTQDDRRQRGEPIIVRTLLYFYQPLLHFFLRNRWFAVALSLILLLTGARVFTQLGMEFTPRLNEGDLIVNLTMAPSISLQETKRLTMIAERRMMQIPEVESVVSRIGRGEVGAHADPINTVHALVVLKPIEAWRPDIDQAAIEAELRHRLSGLPGILVNLTQPIQLTVDELVGGVKAELAVKLYGDDLQILKRYADEIAALLLTIPGAEDVQTEQLIGSPQLLIRPKREALARYGINLVDVQETIRAAIGGVTAGQVFDGVRRFDIYVRYQEEQRRTVEDVARLLVTAPTGERLPLGQLASIKTLVGPRQITRENNQRFATVQANIVGRDIGSFVAQAQRRIEQDIQLPPGYLISWGGQFELAQQANQRLALVVPITLGLIFLLLYMSFGSIRNSLLILLNIPLALVGGVISLWLLGENLSVPASVGFIALFGIALTNGMVLVTYLNQLVRQGLPIEEACKQGASQRLRPVLMTAITTALGLIPLLLASSTGSEVQRPLAAVVIGGLLTSTILTLLVAPAMYQWFALRTDKPRKLKGE
ncbi:MAG: CusA/CzcA family heavy metal efflux RND transporter [Candidatus Thiodiazotropha weberae]|nr:CusA/CzcA family heavy metal efflux RND transporter [Candidatus Thiodiazotropha lotti]MCG8020300.1 CusA/CzcA family heavy metal efflux RND transporter [Candidatus Thiodiazotropha lotti]MCW4207463.1 CusA/CzcA family heavy metal efflux RND transporter [Candidatus Thiodiazotropha lotti]MCW4215971.1 CusA/CzcA family heavy metal efflux RND transporter [Candidatus Thiodiazotropha lotti]